MTPDQAKAAYRRSLNAVGERVIVRRYSGTGDSRTSSDVEVAARVVDFTGQEMVGTVQAGDRKLIVLTEDLVNAGFSLPLRKGDKAVVRGRELNIESPDDNTRRIAGVLVAYELQVRG